MNIPHPGSEHLIILPDRDVAQEIAEDLLEEGFEQIRVIREVARTEEDDEDAEWAVYVVAHSSPDVASGGTTEALRERFTQIARRNDGWYDAPGDSRPPTR